MNGTLTYAQVDEMSDALAAYLRDVAGLSAGDRVAVQMPNGLTFSSPLLGFSKRGACWSTLTRCTRLTRWPNSLRILNLTL